jgi:protein TonB
VFTMLVASGRPPRGLARAAPGSMLSLAIHGLLLGGAIVATTKPNDVARPIDTDTIPIVLPQPVAPARGPVAPALPVLDRPPVGSRTVIPVVRIPTGIPPVDPAAPWNPADWTGRGRENGVARGGPGGTGPLPVSLERVYVQAVVDEPPLLLSGPPLRYPPLLRDAGIEGEVVVEVVIGVDGRPEVGTLRVIRSSNHAFEKAARAALGEFVYRPGRMGGEAVRVLIRQPVRFEIVR